MNNKIKEQEQWLEEMEANCEEYQPYEEPGVYIPKEIEDDDIPF